MSRELDDNKITEKLKTRDDKYLRALETDILKRMSGKEKDGVSAHELHLFDLLQVELYQRGL